MPSRVIWGGGPLLASFLTIVEVILVCSFGALLAHVGVITQPVRQSLSKVGFYLLLPAITFVKVAEAVDASILREWWPLAANLVFSILLGAGLGAAASLMTPPRLRRTFVVASSIGNINTIPLLVVASLCQSDELMFFEVLGRECSTKGIAYVAVGMAIGSVFHHSIAFHMLKPPPGEGGGGDLPLAAAAGGPACATCGAPVEPTADGAPPSYAPTRADSLDSWLADDVFTGIETLSEAAHYLSTPAHRHTRPTTPAPWARSRPGTAAPGLTVGLGLAGPVRRSRHSAPETVGEEPAAKEGADAAAADADPTTFLGRALSGGLTSRFSFGGGSRQRTTPRSSGTGGVGVGGLPTSHHPDHAIITLSADSATLAAAQAQAAHAADDDVKPLTPRPGARPRGARARCAACCAPLAPVLRPLAAGARIVLHPIWRLLVLFERLLPVPALISLAGIGVGCCPPLKRLFFGPKAPLEFVAHALHTVAGATVPIMSFILGAVLYRGPGKGTVRWHVIAAVCFVRLVAVPLLGAVVVFGTEALNWWVPIDPLFVFVLLLQGIAPTAINMQAIATMFRYNEQEMAVLIFWQHALYLVALPLYICGCMFWIEKLPLSWKPGGELNKLINDPGLTP